MIISLKLTYHEVYFSAAWCKRSLLYDQKIEDINIFSLLFLVELRGVAQLTPLSPTQSKQYQKLKWCNCTSNDNVNIKNTDKTPPTLLNEHALINFIALTVSIKNLFTSCSLTTATLSMC